MNNPNEIPVIVVIGGGYAGLQTLLMLKKELRVHALKTGERQTVPNAERKGKAAQAKLILIDRNADHLRKVLLFRGAVHPEKTKIPFANLAKSDIEFLQADVLGIHASERQLELKRPDGRCETLAYDRLVIATGSVPRTGGEERGGFDLSNPEETDKIREALEAGSRSVQTLVVGGGLSGIEMAAELADELRRRLRGRGLTADHPVVTLIDSGERLLPQASAEVGERLERELRAAGVSLLHGRRAVRFAGGRLELEDGESLPADLCVWALGLQASPAAAKWGLPVDEVGRIVVDASLRIGGWAGCYAAGDCARIVDPATGRVEGMSCREGTSQAKWLAKAIRADLEGRAEPAYRSAPLVLCASLGPARGFAWTRLQGRDIVLTGSLGLLARRYTWKLVDLLPD